MVNQSDIPIISFGRYVVDSSGNFTPDMFTSYNAVALAKLEMDAPNLTGVIRERAIGLLICHYIEVGLGRTHYKTISAGSGSSSFDDAGSSWMKEYREIIGSYIQDQERSGIRNKLSTQGITHSDADTRGL